MNLKMCIKKNVYFFFILSFYLTDYIFKILPFQVIYLSSCIVFPAIYDNVKIKYSLLWNKEKGQPVLRAAGECACSFSTPFIFLPEDSAAIVICTVGTSARDVPSVRKLTAVQRTFEEFALFLKQQKIYPELVPKDNACFGALPFCARGGGTPF